MVCITPKKTLYKNWIDRSVDGVGLSRRRLVGFVRVTFSWIEFALTAPDLAPFWFGGLVEIVWLIKGKPSVLRREE